MNLSDDAERNFFEFFFLFQDILKTKQKLHSTDFEIQKRLNVWTKDLKWIWFENLQMIEYSFDGNFWTSLKFCMIITFLIRINPLIPQIFKLWWFLFTENMSLKHNSQHYEKKLLLRNEIFQLKHWTQSQFWGMIRKF